MKRFKTPERDYHPSELEQQIVPYLSGELNEAERRRVEQEIATNPEFRRLVEELRQTLAVFKMDVAEAEMEGFEEALYREILARQRQAGLLWGSEGISSPLSGWRRLVGWSRRGLGVAAALAAAAGLALLFSAQGTKLSPFVPVAQLQVGCDPRTLDTASLHQRVELHEIERRLDEAQIAQYVQGEPELALPVYDFILRRGPDTWVSEVAAVERSVLVQTADRTDLAAPFSSETSSATVFP